jgi:hypothetical protein
VASNERDLGAWILPQPIEKSRYVAIPKLANVRVIPFGYRVDDVDENLLQPIPKELDALELAKKYVKQYSYKQVAAWLSKETGRSISEDGLRQRIRREQERGKRHNYYRSLARKYKEALEAIERYEDRLGKEEKTNFFASDYYVSIKDKGAKLLHT